MSVQYSESGEIAIVKIDRPERRNAVDQDTALALYEAFNRFEDDNARTVAILTGSGGTFCSGADLKAISSGQGKALREDGELAPMGPSRMRLSKPVIAAIEGYAVAGGLELALWADLRICGRSAKFGVFCRRFGVPLVDLGTIRLPRMIGQSRAADLILTGREVGAEEAYSIGLVNRVVEDGMALDASLELARSLSAFPQVCLRSDRQSMYEQWDLPEKEATANEIRHGIKTIKSGETVSGADEFSSGRGRHGSFK